MTESSVDVFPPAEVASSEPRKMTPDEASRAFAAMSAIDSETITTEDGLKAAFGQFPEAVSVLAPQLIDKSENDERTALVGADKARWEDSSGNAFELVVDYPESDPVSAAQAEITTPALVIINTNRYDDTKLGEEFRYRLQPSGTERSLGMTVSTFGARPVEESFSQNEGQPAVFTQDEKHGTLEGGYRFAAAGLQRAMQVISGRLTALEARPSALSAA